MDSHYIYAGRFIVEILGEDGEHCDYITIKSCKIYKDDVIEIVSSKVNFEFAITKLDNDNPVLLMDENGKVYRRHGEIVHLKEHIFDLLNKAFGNLSL